MWDCEFQALISLNIIDREQYQLLREAGSSYLESILGEGIPLWPRGETKANINSAFTQCLKRTVAFVLIYLFPPASRESIVARYKETGGGMPPEGVKLISRWHVIGGGRGFLAVESNDPVAMAK
jgi:hypothetical protein